MNGAFSHQVTHNLNTKLSLKHFSNLYVGGNSSWTGMSVKCVIFVNFSCITNLFIFYQDQTNESRLMPISCQHWKREFFTKEDVSDSDEGEGCVEYARKICMMKSVPLNEILQHKDPNAIKQPTVQNDSNDDDDTLPSLPSSQVSLEDDDTETITISSDEDLENSMRQIDTDAITQVSLE